MRDDDAVVSLTRALMLIDSAIASAAKHMAGDDLLSAAMRAGAMSTLEPLRDSMMKLAVIEAPLHEGRSSCVH